MKMCGCMNFRSDKNKHNHHSKISHSWQLLPTQHHPLIQNSDILRQIMAQKTAQSN
ncbi:hypothetical protein [Moraxella nonliquefaciens]|uniref:C2H2-type domain-containing protein n=1 Tax=Moraxella nonliquefaciens TaxID=478 RepID=A0A7T3F0S5_MORNO|nr:hypothetical protein [Moraxella nonliquefaciens]QPT44684.1 hypothetical protein I6G26_01090 [Moraxella nonliquefaciens]QQC29704.1 hypothetical protein I6H63_10550 [Moraxella nonliquefaciens]